MAIPDLQLIRRTIEQRIATEFVDVPVYFGNQQTTPPNNAHWLWCGVNFGDGSYQSLDGLDWVDGVAQVNVFAPVASGTGTALSLAQRLKGLFNRITASGIYFRPANGPRTVNQEATAAWFQMAVSVAFVAEYYQVITSTGPVNLTLNLSLSSSYLGRAF
jgi:hypothetical protein